MDDTEKSFVANADDEVVGFMKLQVDSELNGRQMLQELLKVYPEGIPRVFNGIRILPREVAALIRDKSCHAVYFHPLKERWFFASKLHKEVAEAQLAFFCEKKEGFSLCSLLLALTTTKHKIKVSNEAPNKIPTRIFFIIPL